MTRFAESTTVSADGDWPDDPGARPLYVRKENPDD